METKLFSKHFEIFLSVCMWIVSNIVKIYLKNRYRISIIIKIDKSKIEICVRNVDESGNFQKNHSR